MAGRPVVQVNVTPLFQQGNQVICDIQPPVVHLNRGNHYALQFRLQPGNPPNLHFEPPNDGSNSGHEAFWCDDNDCPNNMTMNRQYANPRLSNGGLTLTVDADPAGANPNAVHYRLNFDNNGRFDPIIIHD